MITNMVEHDKRNPEVREMKGKRIERREESSRPRGKFYDQKFRSLSAHEGFAFEKEDVRPMLDQLLKAGTIELPLSKRPEEASKTKEKNFCHYHRLVGHPTENCYTLKCIIQKMINNG
ncbi:hypothetical protein PJI17_31260, partial [Mycobacterium kansasii]